MGFLPKRWQPAGFVQETATRAQVSSYARGPAYLAFFDRLLAETCHPDNSAWQQSRLLMLAARNLDEWWALQNHIDDERQHVGAIQVRRQALEHVTLNLLQQRMLPWLQWVPLSDWHSDEREHVLSWAQQALFGYLPVLEQDATFPSNGNNSNLWLLLRSQEGRHHGQAWLLPAHLPRWLPLQGPSSLAANSEPVQVSQPLRIASLEEVASFWLEQQTPLRTMGMLRCLYAGEYDGNNHANKHKPQGLRAVEWRGDSRYIQAWCHKHNHGSCAYLPTLWPRLVDVGQLLQLPGMSLQAPPSAKPYIYAPARQDFFDSIRHQDILLHQPFDSFEAVVELLAAASEDSHVSHIYQTIYRVEKNSTMVRLLRLAAKRGKKVTVVVECRARGDEQHNRAIAAALEAAGAHVVVPKNNYKHHGKALLIEGNWHGQRERFCHLGTGNYHAETSAAYTDIGLLTNHVEMTTDLHALFAGILQQDYHVPTKQLISAPHQLLPFVLAQIAMEVQAQQEQGTGFIACKINGLTDPIVIQALLDASQAGVPIALLVRGPCNLRPGVERISDTIQVRSIVGHHLEHARLYCFGKGARARYYCSSADWMTRNLRERLEIAFPILEPDFQAQLHYECITLYWQDNRNAWDLQADGSYVPAWRPNQPSLCAQQQLQGMRNLPWWQQVGGGRGEPPASP